ncbi:hypothetical protein BDF14DRAFT_291599 [Spinellus fusiger]|nr:hypothetical protein BDF14DRAFT_291599 [Spinellus fusiger]
MGVVQSKRRKHLKGDTTHGATIHNSGQAHSSAYHPTSHQSTATEGSGYSHQLRDSSSSNTGSYGIGGLKGSRTSHSSPSTPNYSSLTSPSVQKPFQPKPTTELQFTGLHSNSLFLPVDWDAQDSQLEQHFALKSLFGGLILPAIAAELAHVPFAKVVDIGCGSGTWMMVNI